MSLILSTTLFLEQNQNQKNRGQVLKPQWSTDSLWHLYIDREPVRRLCDLRRRDHFRLGHSIFKNTHTFISSGTSNDGVPYQRT